MSFRGDPSWRLEGTSAAVVGGVGGEITAMSRNPRGARPEVAADGIYVFASGVDVRVHFSGRDG